MNNGYDVGNFHQTSLKNAPGIETALEEKKENIFNMYNEAVKILRETKKEYAHFTNEDFRRNKTASLEVLNIMYSDKVAGNKEINKYFGESAYYQDYNSKDIDGKRKAHDDALEIVSYEQLKALINDGRLDAGRTNFSNVLDNLAGQYIGSQVVKNIDSRIEELPNGISDKKEIYAKLLHYAVPGLEVDLIRADLSQLQDLYVQQVRGRLPPVELKNVPNIKGPSLEERLAA